MNWPDLVNGSFEFCGIFFLLTSILKLHRDKQIRGVHWLHITYFFIWGCWNMFYYPHLGQWFSFAGGAAILVANGYWLGQMIYYTRKEKKLYGTGTAFPQTRTIHPLRIVLSTWGLTGMREPIAIEVLIQRAANDCAQCCLAMYLQEPYARVASLSTSDELSKHGITVQRMLSLARRLGKPLARRWLSTGGELKDAVEGETGILFLKILRGHHYVMLFEGAVANPVDGLLWNLEAYLNAKQARIVSFYQRLDKGGT